VGAGIALGERGDMHLEVFHRRGGALKTARVEPTLVGFTGIVFQSKTAEPITGFWSATANAAAVAATQ